MGSGTSKNKKGEVKLEKNTNSSAGNGSNSKCTAQTDTEKLTLPPISSVKKEDSSTVSQNSGALGVATPPPITNNDPGDTKSTSSKQSKPSEAELPLVIDNTVVEKQGPPPAETKDKPTQKPDTLPPQENKDSAPIPPNKDSAEKTTPEKSPVVATDKTQEMATPAGTVTSKVETSKEEDRVIPLDPEDQRRFDDAVSAACLLIKPESLLKCITKNVTKLELRRALPRNIDLYGILSKLTMIQEIDISNNNIGPEGFRSVCMAMCSNINILSLNLADNKADTDSAECLGKMLSENRSLQYLDISSNYLGKDYFSRCVGPPLKSNQTLKTLRAASIGSTDVKQFLEGLVENTSLMELDFSKNCVRDPAALGKGFALVLKKPECCLESLALNYCEMTWQGIEAISEALRENTSLCELSLTGNNIGSQTNLLNLVVSATCSPNLRNLTIDNVAIKDTAVKGNDVKPSTDGKTSALEILSMSDSHVTDDFFSELVVKLQGKILPLVELDIGANEQLTSKCIEDVLKISSVEDSTCRIRRLNFSLNNNIADLPDILMKQEFPNLQYLNIRRCKIPDVHKLSGIFTAPNSCMNTLILDGLKIANTDTLQLLLENTSSCSLQTLSLSGCSLAPADLAPLCQALKKGIPLHMLKLSANRLQDEGVNSVVEALLGNKTHPLAVLDVSNNTMGDMGAKTLATLFSNKKHKSQLHSLNVSGNNLGKDGLLSLVSVMGGKFPLRTLYLQGQTAGLDEPEMIELYTKLATSLGFTIKKEGDNIKPGCSDLPNLPDGFVVNMTSLGGHTGEIGRMLDSVRLHTDFVQDQLPTLTFGDIQVLCAYLKGTGTDTCLWSMNDWKMVTGASRSTTETPSWLELESSRELAIYMCNLPGNTTQQKIEGMLESEADCNIDEVCLMKDPVTRSNNGVGWALMCDKESVDKAVEFFHNGEAKVFGQAFSISRVKIQIDDQVDAQTAAKAREDLEMRMQQKKKEEQEHRSLIQRKTEESWKRHAYRLAHPAYADGRIW
ncbi:hypothetical protein FSP39_008700 [Pinctada imbricata]|uniref:RRM domain-containing protein n=1 Tax=Pinctada imbricata TaxID=66713 RepID=A0AA89C501_PINIB|nr:hypothetical protein FSP39_008700 [Pinctada imbricata]